MACIGERPPPLDGFVTSLPTNPHARDLSKLGRPKSVAARVLRERIIVGALATAACFSILVTAAIIVVLAKETIGFFQFDEVSLGEFFGGTEWNPLLGAEKHFGIWPLVAGTLLVTVIAASFALPQRVRVAPGARHPQACARDPGGRAHRGVRVLRAHRHHPTAAAAEP